MPAYNTCIPGEPSDSAAVDSTDGNICLTSDACRFMASNDPNDAEGPVPADGALAPFFSQSMLTSDGGALTVTDLQIGHGTTTSDPHSP